jgi:hypothetical protein
VNKGKKKGQGPRAGTPAQWVASFRPAALRGPSRVVASCP